MYLALATHGANDPNPGFVSTAEYLPSNPLAAFNGQPATGNWSLTVSDAAGGDTGRLNGWSLQPTVAVVAPWDVIFANSFEQ